MITRTTAIRPGLLVSLKTSVRGNVTYNRHTLEAEEKTIAGGSSERWETTRLVANKAEQIAAGKARSAARAAISKVCVKTSNFGLLCPTADEEKLNAAVREARAIAAKFNASAEITRLGIYVVTGRIAENDAEALRGINSEIRELLDDMGRGVAAVEGAALEGQNAAVETIRAAANNARSMLPMLEPDAQVRVKLAVDASRKFAREIVRAEGNPVTVDRSVLRAVTESRFAFLDLDDEKEPEPSEFIGPMQPAAVSA